MSATIARQGGWVQLEQSDMRLALNMAKMAKEWFSCAAIEETQQVITKPRTEVWEEKKRGVVFPGHNKVKAAIERHPAMVYKHHTDGCLPCQNGTTKNPPTCWRCKGTSATPPEPVSPLPGMSPPPPGDTDGNEIYQLECMPSRCVYIHSLHSIAQCFNHNAYGIDRKHDKDFIPDLLSTLSAAWKYRWHWFWRPQQPVEQIWEWRQELFERNGTLQYYYYLQLADTLKYILKDVIICMIKEQCSDQW